MRERKDIDEQYTWNLEKIYNSIGEFNSDYDLVKEKIEELAKYEKIMMDSSQNFYEVISMSYDIDKMLEKLYVYTYLSFDLDTSDNNNQELNERVLNLYDFYNENCYFITNSILKCDYDVINKYYEEEPKLREYETAIEEIYRFKEHNLSDAEERLLSSINKMLGNSSDTYNLFKDCDMSFDEIEDENGKKVELNNSNYNIYIQSKDRKVRKSAFETLYKEYKKYSNTFTSLFSSYMKELSTLAKIKKYNSALEMSLFSEDIDKIVYDNLISSIHENIGYIYDYFKLRKEMLGLDELHLYDISVPIVNDCDNTYDYEEAKDTILKVLGVFGEEYVNKVKEALSSRWIDVYPTENKRTGAYSIDEYSTCPYILLNYQDKYNDMSTLIHEMGHSMHSYYSSNYNSYQNSHYCIFVAEVASTVNELLLDYYMLEHSKSREEKLFILNNMMDLYRATIYRQTMFAEFEKTISDMVDNGEVITSDKACGIYYKLNKFYFGNDVVIDDEIGYEWERVPHFYMNFYVYKYATGLSAATVIVKNIREGKDKAVENYIEFLKCGSKKSPLESLKIAGVNLTEKGTIDMAFREFENLLEMYRKNM